LLVWVWPILVARAVRAIDRLLGDGFIERNVVALIDGFEEEITNCVMLRIISRIQVDLGRGQFGRGVAAALAKNKASLLTQVRAEYPQRGVAAEVVRMVGIEAALSRVEEKVFDSIVEILVSAALDKAIRELLDTQFATLRHNIAVKSWKSRIGLQPHRWYYLTSPTISHEIFELFD
jgi:hypothetical protein